MASSKEYLDFILEQVSELDNVSYKAMMGEFIIPTLTVYIVKKPYKSLKSSGLQSFFLCYQMCVQIFIL